MLSDQAISSIYSGNLIELQRFENELQIEGSAYPRDRWGNTALMLATMNAKEAIVDWILLRRLASIEDQNNEGWDAISLAANHGHLNMVVLLFRHYPERINTPNQAGFTPFLAAALGGAETIVDWFITNKKADESQNLEGKNALAFAAINGHTKIITKLLSNGFNVDNKGNQGRTALLEAALNAKFDAVKMLLENHASITQRDQYNFSILHLAAFGKAFDIIKYLFLETNFQSELVIMATNRECGILPSEITDSQEIRGFIDSQVKINTANSKPNISLK